MKVIATCLILSVLLLVACEEAVDQDDLEPECYQTPEIGSCDAAITKYYYDAAEKNCRTFVWGGCDGVVPFDTVNECMLACDVLVQ